MRSWSMKFVCKLNCRLPRYRQTSAAPMQVFLYSSIKINKQVELFLSSLSLSLSLYIYTCIYLSLLVNCLYEQPNCIFATNTSAQVALYSGHIDLLHIWKTKKNSWNSIAINSLALTVQINSDTQYESARHMPHAFCNLWVRWVLINFVKGFQLNRIPFGSQGSQGSQLKS